MPDRDRGGRNQQVIANFRADAGEYFGCPVKPSTLRSNSAWCNAHSASPLAATARLAASSSTARSRPTASQIIAARPGVKSRSSSSRAAAATVPGFASSCSASGIAARRRPADALATGGPKSLISVLTGSSAQRLRGPELQRARCRGCRFVIRAGSRSSALHLVPLAKFPAFRTWRIAAAQDSAWTPNTQSAGLPGSRTSTS